MNDLTSYLSPASILDFVVYSDNKDTCWFEVQSFIGSNTSSFFMAVQSLTKSAENLLQFNSDVTLTIVKPLGVLDPMLSNTPMFGQNITSELLYLTRPKADHTELVKILPEHDLILDLFEVISINEDNSMYHHLTLPDFKLYYPEPYIASPSFNHEEL